MEPRKRTPDAEEVVNREQLLAQLKKNRLFTLQESATILGISGQTLRRPKVIEHRALIKKCKCGTRNSAMPNDIKAPVQYSPHVKAIANYCSAGQLLPKARTAEMLNDVFGISISEASLVAIDNECSEKLEAFDRAVLESIKQSLVKNADESGVRIAKKTWWLHVLSNEVMTHYRVSPKKGELLFSIVGTIVHDHWKPCS